MSRRAATTIATSSCAAATGPNYDAASVAAACRKIEAARLPCRLMIDASHANSAKLPAPDRRDARRRRAAGAAAGAGIFCVMIEGHLQSGAQKFTAGKDDPAKLDYGRSITDACLGWDDTEALLGELATAVQERRERSRSQGLAG